MELPTKAKLREISEMAMEGKGMQMGSRSITVTGITTNLAAKASTATRMLISWIVSSIKRTSAV